MRFPSSLRSLISLPGRRRCALACALLLAPLSGAAAEVAVVLSQRNEVNSAFVEALKDRLPANGPHQFRDAGSVESGLDEAAIKRAELVIAVGPEAADAIAARGGPPTLAVMLASQNLRAVQGRHPDVALSGMVLDQPLQRQMRMIRAALPQAKRLGVLLGPQSAAQRAMLLEAAKQSGFSVDIEQLDERTQLLPSLERLLEATEVILAIPDPVAFSATSARPVLLTTYRYRRPLVGYSQAYVHAGALAAVHSAPADVARQVADWLATQQPNRIVLPKIEAPRYYSVAINRQVARALALNIPDGPALADAIEEQRQP